MMPEVNHSNPFGFKKITDYSGEELDLAINIAKEQCEMAELDFYCVLRGIDAYMERRKRKARAQSPADPLDKGSA